MALPSLMTSSWTTRSGLVPISRAVLSARAVCEALFARFAQRARVRLRGTRRPLIMLFFVMLFFMMLFLRLCVIGLLIGHLGSVVIVIVVVVIVAAATATTAATPGVSHLVRIRGDFAFQMSDGFQYFITVCDFAVVAMLRYSGTEIVLW